MIHGAWSSIYKLYQITGLFETLLWVELTLNDTLNVRFLQGEPYGNNLFSRVICEPCEMAV